MKKKILIVVGTRPNFIKVTQFKKVALQYPSLDFKIVHTGQHYDAKMADVFFEQFNLVPDFFLNVPPGSANFQIAHTMLKLEELIENTFKPELMIVVGDVNSTLAGAITANKLKIPLAHLESGLRSFDSSMPEEHNRVITDAITDYFFVTEPSGLTHLKKEEKDKQRIYFVGNTMIDTIVAFKEQIQNSDINTRLDIQKNEFILMTMHRPATVDTRDGLLLLLSLIQKIIKKYKVVFPIHPRTLKNIESLGLMSEFKKSDKLILSDPLDYFAFQKLIAESKFVITDSGGIQEETTFLGVPCLTLRPNTERPVTCTTGTNTLVPFDINKIEGFITKIEKGEYKKGNLPEMWDGKSSERIVKIIDSILS